MSDSTLLQLQFDFSPTRKIPLTQGLFALVDAADYDWLMQWKWHARPSRRTWYALREVINSNGKRHHVRMHRIIMDASDGMEVDHRDGDGLNNTRINLRFATNAQNQYNQRAQAGKSSRFKGVIWHKRDGLWRACIRLNGKQYYLGGYKTEEEAAKAYDARAQELFGEFARLNFTR